MGRKDENRGRTPTLDAIAVSSLHLSVSVRNSRNSVSFIARWEVDWQTFGTTQKDGPFTNDGGGSDTREANYVPKLNGAGSTK